MNPLPWLANFWYQLNRSLLAFWVKTTALPANPAQLELDSTKPVFYVLETRSFSNLLVLEQECLQQSLPQPTQALHHGPLKLSRSVSALRRWAGLLRRRPSKQSYSRTLLNLMRTAAAHPELDVQIIPVAIFWGRQPDREQSWFRFLFSDTWSRVGYIRKFFIILAHGRDTWVQFSPPVSLREFSTSGLNPEQAVRKLSRVLRVHFRQVRRAMIGPDLSNRSLTVEQVLLSPSVREAIATEAAEKKISLGKAESRARQYSYEIAADFSYPFILLMRRLLRRLWDRLYDGVVVHHGENLRRSAPGHTLVYLPCHRSHIDYLLLSYVLHAEGLALPYIAAGINLNIPLIGPLLRRGGAFFLRRSFRGNKLYGAAFHAYVAHNLARGAPLEYFLEGTRSRTGRSLTPKLGMLDMTVRAALAHPQRPLVLIPVYIGFEKLVEGRSYLAELSGQPKQKESLCSFFKGLRALRSEFGKVHLNFGEPLTLTEFLDNQHPNWHEKPQPLAKRPEWLPPIVEQLGGELMRRINAAADVNPINLLALTLLATPNQAMDEGELSEQLQLYVTLLRQAPYSKWNTLSAEHSREIITHGIKLGLLERTSHPLGDIIQVRSGNMALLGYFCNNVLHLFALPSLIACCLRRRRALAETQLHHRLQLVYPFLQSELFLRWQPVDLDHAVDTIIEVLVKQQLLLRHNDTLTLTDDSAERRLGILADCISPSLEQFYITVVLLLQAGSGGIDQNRLEQRCQLMAQRLALLYTTRLPDFQDRALFRQVLQILRRHGLVHDDEQGQLHFDTDLAAHYREVWQLLSAPVRDSIAQLTGVAELCAEPVAIQKPLDFH